MRGAEKTGLSAPCQGSLTDCQTSSYGAAITASVHETTSFV